MADHQPRSSYESACVALHEGTGRTAVRVAIGEALKRRSEVLRPVPQEIHTLLMQVDALHEED
jgi:hypothetical protein